jgi:hypothetical protein
MKVITEMKNKIKAHPSEPHNAPRDVSAWTVRLSDQYVCNLVVDTAFVLCGPNSRREITFLAVRSLARREHGGRS